MLMTLRLPWEGLPITLAKANARRHLHCMLALFAIHWNTSLVLAEDNVIARTPGNPSLQFGIMPSQSALTLMRAYAPLKSYLEHTLKREIIISTAPSFPEFLRRTGANEYDFVLTSPHFAKLAEDQHEWVRLARLQGNQRGVFLVEKTSPPKKITDLSGKTLAIRDNLALVTLLGEQELTEKGFSPKHSNISFINSPSYTSAALSVIRGTADAALISEAAFNKLPAADKNHLRVLAYTKAAPNLMLMGNPRLGENDITHLRDALLHFNKGAAFSNNTSHGNFDLITEQDMRFAASFVTVLQQRLSQGQP